MYLGSWNIDDLLTFTVDTHDPDTGAAADADSAPTYRIYEDETGTPIVTGTMALLDDGGTVGQYSEQITLSVANGFEKGKSYKIRIAATVGGVTGVTGRFFQIAAAVDAQYVAGEVPGDSTALQAAIFEYVVEGGHTFEELLRVIVAALVGTITGANTADMRFKSLDELTDRIIADASDTSGNRELTSVDGA